MGFSSQIQMKGNNELLMPFAMRALGLLNKPNKLLQLHISHVLSQSILHMH